MSDFTPDPELLGALRRDGHVLLRRAELLPRLSAGAGLGDWRAVAASWGEMPLDAYMADGGRYRRRRYGVFSAQRDGPFAREPHQPHWQSREYNRLNGGIARWFEPIADDVGSSDSVQTLLAFCRATVNPLAPDVAHWHIEMHQFRIEAALDAAGQPTPEGVHRDGVDYVMVLLVRRENIASGTTTIHAPDGTLLGSFTLTDAFDATLLDDRRVFHGVTPVVPVDTRRAAYRDVLVISFRRAPPPLVRRQPQPLLASAADRGAACAVSASAHALFRLAGAQTSPASISATPGSARSLSRISAQSCALAPASTMFASTWSAPSPGVTMNWRIRFARPPSVSATSS
jgi:hypothetical protein